MGKRSSFERRDKDFYPTPKEAVVPLIPYLEKEFRFSEPCFGEGSLAYWLSYTGKLNHASEIQLAQDVGFEYPENYNSSDGIQWGRNALDLTQKDVKDCDYIITNPPWSRNILHPMIHHFRGLKPTWLLFDAGWMFTKQARDYLTFCQTILSVGRLKWIPDSKYTGKDDCCWYKFVNHEVNTEFINK